MLEIVLVVVRSMYIFYCTENILSKNLRRVRTLYIYKSLGSNPNEPRLHRSSRKSPRPGCATARAQMAMHDPGINNVEITWV